MNPCAWTPHRAQIMMEGAGLVLSLDTSHHRVRHLGQILSPRLIISFLPFLLLIILCFGILLSRLCGSISLSWKNIPLHPSSSFATLPSCLPLSAWDHFLLRFGICLPNRVLSLAAHVLALNTRLSPWYIRIEPSLAFPSSGHPRLTR